MHLTICHLYPLSMSTYGDTGNVRCLAQRCLWRNIGVTVQGADIDQPIPDKVDLYFFGGGQDAAQAGLARDLIERKGERIRQDIAAGVPLLAVCGGYQLLGRHYLPFGQEALPGLGIFPVETSASHDRMIGNIVIAGDTDVTETGHPAIVGFENHSGKTILAPGARPLGRVLRGHGNNGKDRTEGCIEQNAIGCYLHGSVLPKNPHLADWLLLKAAQRLDPRFALTPLNDDLEWQAHAAVRERYA